LLQVLLIFGNVNKNPDVHCLFMLVHGALILTNTTFDFHNVLVNVESKMN